MVLLSKTVTLSDHSVSTLITDQHQTHWPETTKTDVRDRASILPPYTGLPTVQEVTYDPRQHGVLIEIDQVGLFTLSAVICSSDVNFLCLSPGLCKLGTKNLKNWVNILKSWCCACWQHSRFSSMLKLLKASGVLGLRFWSDEKYIDFTTEISS